jgi:hypothetical protein
MTKNFNIGPQGRRSMFDEELDKYNTYEEYLDSLVSEEDHKYLEDEEMARQIAELGYRQILLLTLGVNFDPLPTCTRQ